MSILLRCSMWLRLFFVVTVSSIVWSQQTVTRVRQGGASFEWGWQLPPPGEAPGTLGRYFLTLPEAPQGYQTTPNFTQPTNAGNNNAQPVDIYRLQQKFASPTNSEQIVQIPHNVQYSYITPLYNIRTQHPIQNQLKYDSKQNVNETRSNENLPNSNPLEKEIGAGLNVGNPLPVLQVFKNHNCSDDNTSSKFASTEIQRDHRESKQLFSETSYDIQDANNFGAKDVTNRPLTYRGAVHFRVETPRPHARNERYYYATDVTPTTDEDINNVTQEGINRLVASTQNLISNEDLLRINNAVEKHIREQSDDIIRPRSRINLRAQQSRREYYGENNKPRATTVNEQLENIVRSEIEHSENSKPKHQVLHANTNEYKFISPIIVSDSYNNYKEQIVNNLVSTMVPYIENGYEIVGVRNGLDENGSISEYNEHPNKKVVVNVTPRPIAPTFLAPITVALRLLNANYTETISSVEDHEASDSELIFDTIDSPKNDKTLVQIQESIPLDITHINDVEVHEYLDEGRSNNKGTIDADRSMYNKYVEALKSSKKIQENMNKLLYKYGTMNNYESLAGKEKDQDDSKENLEFSENVKMELQVKPNGEATNNERSEEVNDYNDYGADQKIIQPIIIEKEVPITKFVDRFIERQVPYPERVEVQVPVDRPIPVAVPVEKVVEKPVEVTRYVDKPFPVEVSRPYLVEVKVPYPVEHKVYVDRPVHIPYAIEKVVEKNVVQHVPVPTPVAIPVGVPVEHKVLYPITVEKPVPFAVEVEKPIPVEKVVHKEIPVPYPVETKVPYLVAFETKVPYPVEKEVPVRVEKIVEKPVTVTKYIEKPIHVQVPHPYPVDRIVGKTVEKPVVVTKYVDKPYPVEKRVPYPVDRTVEKRMPYVVQVKVPYPDEKNRHYVKGDESRNNIQYQRPEINQQNLATKSQARQLQAQAFAAQYYQYLKDRQQNINPIVQSTHWGNKYASSYRYVNNTPEFKLQDAKKNQSVINYINYLNARNSPYQYYGPAPAQNQNNVWEKSNNFIVELKMKRTDRVPKIANLNVEYGFKPPLIPSTEVDLDGIPVHKGE